MAQVRIGTSGWMYRHWRGVFYEPGLRTGAWLERYAEEFESVEINNSFYRLPPRQTFESWAERTPRGFDFAVKGSRFITHLKRLNEPEDHVARFFEQVAGLGEKTGPILWQLPPNFHRNDERLSAFLDALPRKYRHAIEFRHGSWLEEPVFGLLEQHGAALCIPDRPGLPCEARLTTDWTYIRFHQGATQDGDYTRAALRSWATRIRAWLRDGIDVWAYFNNDWHGFALDNARTLRALLED